MSRRSIKDKQKENKDLRLLLLSLYKVSNIRVLYLAPIEESLREAILRCIRTESFVAKRRYEREAVNLLREEDEEGIQFLEDIPSNIAELQLSLERDIQLWIKRLEDPEELGTFCDQHPHLNIQKIRQFLRSKKEKHRKALFNVLEGILFPVE